MTSSFGRYAMVRTVVALLGLLAMSAHAEDVMGRARVADGDTIELGGIRVRLQGVDAPEMDAPLGPGARKAMKAIIGTVTIRCALTGERTYERWVGVCFLPDGRDIGAELIRRGAALDCARYSGGRYRKLETPEGRARIERAPYC